MSKDAAGCLSSWMLTFRLVPPLVPALLYRYQQTGVLPIQFVSFRRSLATKAKKQKVQRRLPHPRRKMKVSLSPVSVEILSILIWIAFQFQIAVEGCCHGELDAIYSHIAELEKKHKYNVDLLLICGDFQAIRNQQDLQCMSVPDKFRQLGGFNE